jgi:hypothetical protein
MSPVTISRGLISAVWHADNKTTQNASSPVKANPSLFDLRSWRQRLNFDDDSCI